MNKQSFPRRFYKRVDVQEGADGFAITLDGKIPRTPGGSSLSLPTRDLACAVADEWQAQEIEIRPDTMPLTQLVNTALDRVMAQRDAIIAQTVAYGASDLLCYRAEAPADLVARQTNLWQPLLDWAANALGASLQVTQGVVPVTQPAVALDALKVAVGDLNMWHLTALQSVVPALGSLVLGMALLRGRLSADEALAVSLLDENYQAELWGIDEETRIRHAILQRDMAAAAHLFGVQ